MKNFRSFTGLALMICITSHVSAQRLINSVGFTISTLYGTTTDHFGSKNDMTLVQYYWTYSPRLNIVEMPNASVSLDAPLGVILSGYSTNVNQNYIGYTNSVRDRGFIFGYVVPLCIDFNIGGRSTGDNFNHLGAYLGAGYDYEHFSIFGTKYSNYAGMSVGPVARVGMRFCFNGNHCTSIGAFYKRASDRDKLHTIGVSLVADI